MLINKLQKAQLLGLTLIGVTAGCSDNLDSQAGEDFDTGISDNTVLPTEFSEPLLLENLTDAVLIPSIENFNATTQPLADSIQSYCAALATSDATDELTQAQQNWRTTMNSWQQIEVMQMGPVSYNDSSLRNAIYYWPVVRHCAVDQDVGHFEAGQVSGKDYDIANRTSDRKGLVALEYLLFNDSADHSCRTDSLAPAGWNTRPAAERMQLRCNFAVEVASHLQSSGETLLNEWQLAETGFATQLKQAGSDASSFATTHDAINKISDAMFYIDSVTKDAKLAGPIGLNNNSCGTATCLDDIESILSDNAVANIKHNLIGLQSLFLGAPVGTDGIGFDDYLVEVDAAELANTMAADIQAAIDAADSFTGSMELAVTNEPDKVQTLHAAVKAVTDNMKSLFITYLSLELPLTSAGDAD